MAEPDLHLLRIQPRAEERRRTGVPEGVEPDPRLRPRRLTDPLTEPRAGGRGLQDAAHEIRLVDQPAPL